MSTKQLSLLLVLLFTIYAPFNVTSRSILGFKKGLTQRSTPVVRDVAGNLATNAERILAGLPIRPPARRPNRLYNATARRSTSAFVPMSGKILVKAAKDSKALGYISTSLHNGMYTLTKDEETADVFTTYAHSFGITTSLNLKDKATSNFYLGGVIQPGDHIGSSSNKVAKLAPAGATKRGDTPQSRSSTIPGDVETAIWSYDSETQELSAQWVNEGTGLEHMVPTTILGRRDSNGRYHFMLSRRLSGDDDAFEGSDDDGSVEGLYDSDEDDDFVENREDLIEDGDSVSGDDSVDAREDSFEDGDSVVTFLFSTGQETRRP